METTLAADREHRWSSGTEMARRLELCTNPKACALLFPSNRSFRVKLRRYAVLIVFVAAGLPNVLAGVFNYCHNVREIVGNLGNLEPLFELTQAVINGIAYPVGAVLFWYLGFSVFRGLQRCQARQLLPERGRMLRQRCLELGRLVALISVVEWSIAACAYPIGLRIVHARLPAVAHAPLFLFTAFVRLGGGGLSVFCRHVFSHCGRCTPFFSGRLQGSGGRCALLRQVGRRNSVYLVVAALAPFLAIAALIADSLIKENVHPTQGRRHR